MLTPKINPTLTLITDRVTFPIYATGSTLDVPVDQQRPCTRIDIDGTPYFFNGHDIPFYPDITAEKLFPLGSEAPTQFAVADAAGTTFPNLHVRFYYLVFRNDDRFEETCPQLDADGVAGYEHTKTGIGDRTITWDDPGDGRWTHAAIYVRRPLTDDFVLLDMVPIANETYTDDTPDADLSTLQIDVYVPRYRTTYAPPFSCATQHFGRILGVTGKDANVYYSQFLDPTGELTLTDFPAGNIIAIEPDDGLGPIVAIFAHYDTTVVLKRHGIYTLEGDFDPLPTIRRMFSGRGCIGPRAWVSVHSAVIVVDELGPYAWTPGSEPQVIGVRGTGNVESPLAPTWKRLNRDAASMIHVTHKEYLGFVEFRIPIDHQPIPMHRVRWNLRQNRFESIDDVVSLAAGVLESGSGIQHDMRADDLGNIIQEDFGVAELLEDGGIEGTRPTQTPNSSSGLILGRVVLVNSFDTDTLLGPSASPLQRRDADGTLLDSNRVFAHSAPDIVLLYWHEEPAISTQSIDVGVVPATVDFPHWDLDTSNLKRMPRMLVRFKPQDTHFGLSPNLKVYTGHDESALTLRRSVDVTNDYGQAAIPSEERGFRLKVRFEAHRACDTFVVPAMTAFVRAIGQRR